MKEISRQLHPSLSSDSLITLMQGSYRSQTIVKDLADVNIFINNHLEETEKIIIVLDSLDEKGKLSNESPQISLDSSTQQLAFWMLKLPEEYRANLVDYRRQWYEGKPLIWYTHLEVSWLTLLFIIWEVPWSHISYWLQRLFQPMHRPRL
ncbi:MAG TPA: hypothetical protein DCL61_32790 [Cyanobacteria bacterium UBA12227]|nr:hypothetical protein [Cyanobacteria bacterium UBA12227]